MNSCFYGKHNEKFDEIIKHWNGKKILTQNIGKIGGNAVENYKTELYLNDVAEHLFKLPFDSSFEFTDGMIRRMKTEINNIEHNYRSKKLGWFRKNFYVSDAIANYSPVTRMFYESVNEVINYERNKTDHYLSYTRDISTHIRKALINQKGLSDKQAKKYLKDMTKIEEKLLRGEGTEADNDKLLREYENLFIDNGESVVGDYVKLMEMPVKEYSKEKYKYDKNLQMAVEESRNLLNDMGGVLIRGLGSMKNVVQMMYETPVLPKTGEKYVEKIKDAIKNVENGIKNGDYFPHYMIDNIVEANFKMKKLLDSKTQDERIRALGDITEGLEMMTAIPDPAKGRNVLLQNVWSKNPFHVLTQYSKDVIAFNKINFIQEKYIPAMKRFQKEDANPEFIRGMREYLDDTFQIATMGLQERPNWVNATVRSIMAVETLKSMGLSVTGAIRNGASAAYFFAENGVKSAHQSIKKYNSHYEKILGPIEADQGFKFAEAGKELVAEGLIPSSVNQSDIVYDPIKNKISYRDKGVLKTLDPMIDRVVGGSLILHRITENFSRKWMFRIAWVQAYENLKGKQTGEPVVTTPERNDKRLQDMATRAALKMVNKYAFEYAPHAKARAIGGTAPKGELGVDGLPKMSGRDKLTALGEVTFQFMHYPMSFLNLQAKILKGAKDALMSKQYDMSAQPGERLPPEMKQAMRFAGIYMTVGALSVITNLDLTNSLENDTVKKIQNLADYLTKSDDELEKEGKLRGVVNDFTGPAMGDMLYGLNMLGWLKMPDKHWQKIALGYIDFYEEEGPDSGKDIWEKRHFWNRLNTELARWVTKTGPAIRDGRGLDIFRHELGWYPRSDVKESRKTWNERIHKMTGYKPFKEKKGRKTTLKSGDISKAGEENLMRLLNELRQ